MSEPIIIGLTGKAGTGKSTVSHELVRKYGFTRLAFADPLKDMLGVLLRTYGMGEVMIKRHIDGDLKEVPCDALGGKSSRWAQQRLGTEWGRGMIHHELWVHHLVARAIGLIQQGIDRIVVDDVRMNNEAEAIVNWWGVRAEMWEVLPTKQPRRSPPAHASEVGINGAYITHAISHDFTMPSLAAALDERMLAVGLTPRGVWAS